MKAALRDPIPTPRTTKPVTVLIVDDDPENRRTVRRVLERAFPDIKMKGGINIAEGADGEEAIQLVHELHPPLVLIDIAMPRLNGLEATRRIKVEEPATKVIMLTAHDERAYREAAIAIGADAFLAKKTLMTSLVPTIKTLWEGMTRPLMTLKEARAQLERDLIQRALLCHNWNISRAAEDLGVSRQTLYEAMHKHGLRKPGSGDVDPKAF